MGQIDELLSYDGRRTVVTGCASGIGAHVVRQLAELGAHVVGLDKQAPNDDIAEFYTVDLTDSTSPWSPFHSATTLSVYIWKVNSEGLSPFVQQIADTSSAILIGLVLVFNVAARGLGRALQRRVTGG